MSSALVFALSGLGKSTLCDAHPETTYDTDSALDSALAAAFPSLPTGERRRAWRALARREPWTDSSSPEFRLWANTRRRFVETILDVLSGERPRLVLTNLKLIPWRYDRYYGVELGRYERHFEATGRARDNDQTEAVNNKLEGFSPLTRLRPGTFLSEDPKIIGWLNQVESESAF